MCFERIKEQKYYKFIVLFLLSLLLLFIGFEIGVNRNNVGLILSKGRQSLNFSKTNDGTEIPNPPQNGIKSCSEWFLRDQNIYCRPTSCGGNSCPQKEIEVFSNADFVSSVRLGFEGSTLHLKFINPLQTDFVRCVKINNLVREDMGGINFPLSIKEVLKAVGTKQGLDDCGFFDTSGFLQTGNYFVYLEERSRDLTIFDLNDKLGSRIDIHLVSQPEFLKVIRGLGDHNAYESERIEGEADSAYYPQADFIKGDVMILAFGKLILVADIKGKRILDIFSLAWPEFDYCGYSVNPEGLNFTPDEKSGNSVVLKDYWETFTGEGIPLLKITGFFDKKIKFQKITPECE